MRERGLCVDHPTIYRWVQRYAPEIDKRCRPFLRRTNDSYRIDETYVRVAGAWTYLYRGVDSNGALLAAALVILPVVAYAPSGAAALRNSVLAPYVTVVADIANPLVPDRLSGQYRDKMESLRQYWQRRRVASDQPPAVSKPPWPTRLDVALPWRRFQRRYPGFLAASDARQEGGHRVLPQDVRRGSYDAPSRGDRGQEPRLPGRVRGRPTRGTRPTAFESSPMQVSEQHHRAGPPIHQTPHPADAGLQAIHHGVADLARHRDHACAPQGTGAMDGEGRPGRADAADPQGVRIGRVTRSTQRILARDPKPCNRTLCNAMLTVPSPFSLGPSFSGCFERSKRGASRFLLTRGTRHLLKFRMLSRLSAVASMLFADGSRPVETLYTSATLDRLSGDLCLPSRHIKSPSVTGC